MEKKTTRVRKMNPGEIDHNDPNIIDVTPEEVEIEEEIKNLSPEEREKIGWGLNVIGFKAEKAKNDIFAWVFNKALKLKDIDPKGTTGKFCKEMKDGFVRDAKIAVKKAKDTTSGKEKHRLSNASLLFGNVLRYGRIVTDLTGKSLASPLRYVMMGGMATTRMAEAGKEARLKNEEVIEKTRIQDANLAYEEAMKIYERAKTKEKIENISAETLKNAYLMEIPKDLQERITRNPSTANTLIQKIVKTDIEGAITRLNKKIEKLENNKKLTPEQKKAEIEKLITKQKKNLEDYDRIITQYGTVDGLAMAGRYAQTAGKAIVAVVTAETLVLSVEKLFETLSHVFSNSNVYETLPSHVPAPKISVAPIIPENPPVINNFTNEGIKFEHGKGGIQGILDLKKQIAEQYNGDYSKAPESVQNFMNTDATKEAIKLGLYAPNNPDESALIREGSILKFDEKGNIIFHDAKTGEDVTHYAGKMFDSDRSAKISTTTEEYGIKLPQEPITAETHPIETTPNTEPTATEALQEKIKAQIDVGAEKTNITNTQIRRPELGYQTVRVGNTIGVGGGNGSGYLNNQFQNLSFEDKLTVDNHPGFFASNPYGLNEEKLIQVYKINNENINYLFNNKISMSAWNTSDWDKLGDLKAGKILEYTDGDQKIKRLSDYLNLLKNFTRLEPKSGFLGMGAENSEYYIARCLQKLVADGKLEQFEADLKK
ncbi:MAG: hypothetical protein AAB623_00880 [Patescibacteria group bacterium]